MVIIMIFTYYYNVIMCAWFLSRFQLIQYNQQYYIFYVSTNKHNLFLNIRYIFIIYPVIIIIDLILIILNDLQPIIKIIRR
jgi:hypothetical protein